ncbi:MAG: hypothetical protein ACKOPN_06740 [Prochlorococcaceae cyanobacterium]
MLLRLRLVIGSVMGGAVVLVAVLLGAQNLDERPRIHLLVGRSAPLPAGVLVGGALAAGLIGGGCAVALLAPLTAE